MTQAKLKLVGIAMALAFCSAANAKTLYVEVFGIDTTHTCSKSNPCDSIQNAIDNAGKNGRVIVGPGVYSENLRITEPGIRLISVGGAGATIINVSDANPLGCSYGNTGICIEPGADKSMIGQNRKGFLIQGHFASGPMIYAGAAKTRIEGNVMTDNATIQSGAAIVLEGAQSSVRYNKISNFEHGVEAFEDGIDDLRFNVSDNYMTNMTSDCIVLYEHGNSRTVARNNYLKDCAEWGIWIDGKSGDPEEPSKVKIHSNIVINAEVGIEVAEGGNADIKGNAVFNTSFTGIAIATQRGASVTNNAIVNSAIAISVNNSQEIKLNSNSIVSSTDDGVVFSQTSDSLKQAQRNNFIGVNCPIDLPNSNMDNPVIFSKNFWGDLTNPVPSLACDTEANNALGVDLELNPSAKPNPVKYKQKI